MSQMDPAWAPKRAAALAHAWGEYRVWAATARQQRAELFSWRFRVLLLTAIGAVLGTLSQALADHGVGNHPWVSLATVAGLLSGIIIALATFFSKEILSPERERRWVRARSMAEALKTETYLFRTSVSPYDAPDAAERLLDRTKELLTTVSDVQSATLSAEQRRERLPAGPLTVSDYIAERVDDQIDNFYLPRATQYQALLARNRGITLGLGALATILGVIGATGWTAGWVAVITTITSAIAAYLYGGRYQYLIVSYQATARQLDALKSRWTVLGTPEADAAQRDQFVHECEGAISIENNGWMATWLERPAKPTE